MNKTCHLLLILLILSISIKSQVSVNRPSDICTSPINQYFYELQDHSSLYYGKSEKQLPYKLKSPYLSRSEDLSSDSYHSCDLLYDNIYYPGILARVNLYWNEISVLNPSKTGNIVLDSQKVSYLNIQDQHLIYLTTNLPDVSSGLFIRLYSNHISILKKYKFSIVTLPSTEYQLNSTPLYYLYSHGEYQPIKNQNSILKALKSHEKELKEFIKENNINFRTNLEESFIKVAQQYEKMNGL